ncbi:hypothetical protein [Salimicrobium flavidum]|uniref:Uncharacterized protein n=1 Tax=Salimicrobium flavidum TaxID=570947 RepID=A0A1N7J2I8_9BACI|nr:hypothetical protein [Salimicrobium flavidum]SIS43563.1 hypothetical protein SAMN05421687_103252 [Salimicrobium flavidum]
MKMIMERTHEYVKEYEKNEQGDLIEIASVLRYSSSNKDGTKRSRTESLVAYYRPYPIENLTLTEREELQSYPSIRKESFISLQEANRIQEDFKKDPYSIFTFTPSR